ncbi:MAG: hydantoinase B/oxoprolinase family protein [Cyanobacteria bacterium SZAS LIN-3]|nr:hydantoinase B/oxoprolinase family protein [Cyanobacteria bacterium SZAS LIN-3]
MERLSPREQPQTLHFSVDRGGTFTDVVARTGDGRLLIGKMLSQSQHYRKDPAVLAIEKILAELQAEDSAAPQNSFHVEEVRLGTTVATNALLERQGEPTVLITNKGFGDALIIGYQNRPDIFALDIDRQPPLFQEVIELGCRFDKDGRELSPFCEEEARDKLQTLLKEKGLKSAAIIFMHGYKYPQHELACARVAQALGFEQISLSHQVSSLIRYVSRGDTTLIDAYLTPPLKRYIDNVKKDLNDTSMLFMKSDGGLAQQAAFSGKDAILSGPAGGVVGAVAMAKKQGKERVIAFDMGGTSTDVSYYEGTFEKQLECTVAGVRLRAPMLAVHTVAAGGGSILSFDGARFRVGPHSARAVPGPACYGLGGPATITDANLVLGRLSLEDFPRVFGHDGASPLDSAAAHKRIQEIAAQIKASPGNEKRYQCDEEIAEGFLTVAVEKMAQAIAKVSIQKGHDVRGATLVAFGGAGGQHACMIAEQLSVDSILLSPLAGVLSAYGIGATELTDIKQKTVRRPLTEEVLQSLTEQFAELTQQTLDTIGASEKNNHHLKTTQQLGLAYRGSDTTLLIDYDASRDTVATIVQNFKVEHKKLFGFVFDDNAIMIESILVESRSRREENPGAGAIEFSGAIKQKETVDTNKVGRPWQIFYQGKMHDARLYRREDLHTDMIIEGPALIAEPASTSVIEPNWQAHVQADGSLLVSKISKTIDKSQADTSTARPIVQQNADPVQLELFNNIFMSIAEEMGITLQRVSHSVNIKERLDFSCAIFDREGRLIANAPHMPVHLGSMGDSVVSLIRAHGDALHPGEAYVLNNPYNGGTHLPDITVVSPVFGAPGSKDENTLLFFVGSRGHHADVGGITPGSMPPLSKNVEEEGVLIDNFRVLSQGQFAEEAFIELLQSARYPARNITQNVKDLKAQIAANVRGQEGLYKIIERYGLSTVQAYMEYVRQNAAKSIRDLLKTLRSGAASCTMDDGSEIKVKITVDNLNCSAVIDFSGTSAETKNNLNTPLAVTRAAVLYVFRTLATDSIPLNDGCSEPLTLIVPDGSLLNPNYPSAVVAGNVETSQVIVDTLYQALGALAGSQGTMNNFTFGDAEHQYYETIAGGSGAGPGFAGTDAIQTHMTNSRLTDPEILEERFPVLLEEFSIRKGSGGKGLYQGGAGARRRIRFLKGMTASILSNRRTTVPPGLNGGGNGQPGANFVVAKDGRQTALPSTATVEIEAGQSILIETPGGGGCGQIQRNEN